MAECSLYQPDRSVRWDAIDHGKKEINSMKRSHSGSEAKVSLTIALLFSATANVFSQTPVTVTRNSAGALVHAEMNQLQISVCNSSVVHITGGTDAPKPSSVNTPWIIAQCTEQHFSLEEEVNSASLSTSDLQVKIDLASGALSFLSGNGKVLISEYCRPCTNIGGARSYEPVGRPEDHLYRISEHFQLPEYEALYGLGQHQSGVFNYRGTSTVLSQVNTDIAVPFLVSTRGYGLIWNTAARTTFDNRFSKLLKLTSIGQGLDFYFIVGSEFDQIIHHYRDLTGHSPLFAEWAYGLFQSKDRYSSQNQLVQIVEKYRSQHIPLDTIVQDWHWWTKQGSDAFNSNYPDFAAAVRNIHDDHAHVMISVWPKFDSDTAIWQAIRAHGYLLAGDNYDATNPAARDIYWKMLLGSLLAKGVDALWLDAAEPQGQNGEGGIAPDQQLFFGRGDLYTNVYPFMHTYGVYRHWRDTSDSKRVFILARSSFLGQQRNAAAAWSGDVYSNFWALKRQVPAGLNFALSGMPYWTTDIGGYGFPSGDTSDPLYQEVFTRWFQFGSFCPLFRVHGNRANDENELWSYGAATPVLMKFDKLRYRMLPYIYSLAWRVTNNDYTIMRPLVMDWRNDRKTWEISDQYMFGPALLVNPVTEAGATSRPVYLPAAAQWYDFWTGGSFSGNQTVRADAPLDLIPIYIRAGSILPLGPQIEYAGERSDQPTELRVYPGANGSFTLYEDEGDGYGYEHGGYATISLSWDEATRTLLIGQRKGSYPGMRDRRTFDVVWTCPGHGIGSSTSTGVDREVMYVGREIRVSEH
jgi:alpha-D-xyloside xylohydrolase